MKKLKGDRVEVHGVGVDCLSLDQVVERIKELLQGSESHLVATADTSGIVFAQTDEELMRAYHSATLVTADSLGVIWALGRRGVKQDRATGVELVDRLFQVSSQTGQRIAILGSAPGVAKEAAEALCRRHPGAVVAGTWDGYYKIEKEDEVVAQIAAAMPDILFVAMGIPRQEKFILKHKDVIGAKVSVGVGGSFDVYSGRVKRAPGWVQKANLEWLWRILSDPKKAKKAAALPQFVKLELSKGRR